MNFLILVLFGVTAPNASPAGTVWEIDPYQVQIFYATPDAPEWSARRAASFSDDLTRRCEAIIGGVWRLAVAPAPDEIERLMARGLDRDGLEEPSSAPAAKTPRDKLLLLRIAPAPDGFSAEAREWDVASRVWGPAISRTAPSAARVAPAAAAALVAAFSPLARWETVAADLARISVRAGDLAPRDVSFKLAAPGDAFRLVRRAPRTPGESAGSTNWFWLTVDSVDGPRATCRMRGSSAAVLRSASREAWLALRTSPARAASELRLVSAGDDGLPLAGFEVRAGAPGETAPRRLGLTDAEGRLRIAPDTVALRLVTIGIGGRSLARFPLSFGLTRRVDVRLRVDEAWLKAQATTAGLERELTDLVAARQVRLARARAKLAARSFDEADKLLADLRGLATLAPFDQRLQDERKPIFSSDAALQKQIERMFDELRSAAGKHLDAAPLDALAAEIQAARSSGALPAAAEAATTPK
ncbi:MAG TPA: hypothetical protein VMV69_01415 [Pirellulales bacterium]|nr:hypothetical protein [Pirellulales bacterium]